MNTTISSLVVEGQNGFTSAQELGWPPALPHGSMQCLFVRPAQASSMFYNVAHRDCTKLRCANLYVKRDRDWRTLRVDGLVRNLVYLPHVLLAFKYRRGTEDLWGLCIIDTMTWAVLYTFVCKVSGGAAGALFYHSDGITSLLQEYSLTRKLPCVAPYGPITTFSLPKRASSPTQYDSSL